MRTYLTDTQRIIASLLLGIFLLESCYNPSIAPQTIDQQKNAPSKLGLTYLTETTSTHEKNQPLLIGSNKMLLEDREQALANTEIIAQKVDSSVKQEANTKTTFITRTQQGHSRGANIPVANRNNAADAQEIAKNRAGKHHTREEIRLALTTEVFLAHGGHQVTFEQQEDGQWQAVVEENIPAGFSRSHRLPIVIEPGRTLAELVALPAKEQARLIHMILTTPATSHVYIGHRTILGGGKEDKEKGEKDIIEEKGEKEANNKGDDNTTTLVGSNPIGLDQLPKEATKTLWQMGYDLGEERFRDRALELLGTQALETGTPKAIFRYLKKLNVLGNINKIVACNQRALPAVWRGKDVEEVQGNLYALYIQALEKMDQQITLSSPKETEHATQQLTKLELQYHFQALLERTSKERAEILEDLQKGLNSLSLLPMKEIVKLRRIYLNYLVTEAVLLDLQENTSHVKEFIEKVAEIAQKGKDKAKTNKKERKALNRYAGKLYQQIGDLSDKIKPMSAGIGKSKEWQRSFYTRAVKLGNSIAHYRLGQWYDEKTSLDYNPRKAKEAFEEAADHGHVLACYKLAEYYEAAEDNKLASSWYERAAQKGHPIALYKLYQLVEDKKEKEKEAPVESGIAYLEQAALLGHGPAQYELGKLHWESGQYSSAVHWYTQAGYQGIQACYAFLGLAAAKGLGLPRDSQLALDYYLRAEKAGVDNPMARYGRARLYERERGMLQDLGTALLLYKQASELGHPKAAYYAGRLHLNSTVPGSDITQAYGLLEKAAKAGIYQACFLLGQIHEHGWGRGQDIPAAVDWYRQASMLSNTKIPVRASALYHLGWLYKLGKGIQQDEAAALAYFEQADMLSNDRYVKLEAEHGLLQDKFKAHQEMAKAAKVEFGKAEAEKEAAYKKLEMEKQAQEVAYKKQEEERPAQEFKRIGEVIKTVTDDRSTLDKVIKAFAPNGEAIVNALARNSTSFGPSGNAFTEIDMAVLVQHPKFKQLTSIGLNSKKLDEVSLKILGEHLKNVSDLELLYINNNQIGDTGIQALAPHLQHLSNLQHLDLSSNRISEQGMQALALQLQHLSNLKYLDLQYNQIGVQGMQVLALHLKHLSNLQHLDLDNNQIGDTGIQALAPQLKELTKLQQLYLGSNQMGDAGIQALAPQLKYLIKLEGLYLENNQIGEQGMQALALHLKHLIKLEDLYLENNRIGNQGMQALAPHLKDLINLQNLYLENNRIGDIGVQALAPTLKHLSNLNRLYLQNNQIGDAGIQALAPHLKGLINLNLLDLQNNQIGDVGIQAFAPQLQHLNNLGYLYLNNNQIGVQGMQVLAPQLQHLSNLKYLCLNSNRIHDQGIQTLAPRLKHLINLGYLYLSNNQIGDIGAKELVEHLKDIKGKSVCLQNNQISKEIQDLLKQQCPGISWTF